MWTGIFYLFVSCVAAAPFPFMWQYWHKARTQGWSWTTEDSRDMYVDAVKTVIAASGIAVALLASNYSSGRTASHLVALSAKVAVVSLISCVCFSLVAILALLRGHELAKGRNIEEQRRAGHIGPIIDGKLNSSELLFILVSSGIALSCFLVGFIFLGRIAFHF